MYNPDYMNWGQQGWICSICGKSLSPYQFFCPFCNDKHATIQTDKTTVIPFDDKGWWDDYQRRSTGDAEAINQLWKQFTVSSGVNTVSSGTNIEITPSGAILYHGPAMECYL